MIEYTQFGAVRKHLFLHNPIADYRSFDPSATSTPLYAAPVAGRVISDAWQPIETAPMDGTEILAWRSDCGQFIASYTSPSAFPMTQAEIDEMDEEALFAEDWFTQWPQALRLEGSETPTHWMPLPAEPAIATKKKAS